MMSGTAVLTRAAEVVSAIRAEHDAAQSSAHKAVAHAIRAGELLIEAKASLKHGEFGAWLAANIRFTKWTAQAYMRLAQLDYQKRDAVTDLSLRRAIAATRDRNRPKETPAETPAHASAKRARSKRQRGRPTISNAEYLALRQKFVNSVIARCVPSVKRSAGELLGTDELAQLRDAICAVVDQFIHRADDSNKHAKPQLVAVNREGTQ